MKLSEIKGEEALDVIADLIEPVAKVMADQDISNAIKNGKPKLLLAKDMIKNHKAEVIEIMAILERKKPEEYVKEITLVSLPKKLLEILNDEELTNLFT